MKKIFTTIIMSWLCAFAMATDYYVSPTGSNATGDGSVGNPWQTIQFAINSAAAGDVINVAAGTYAEKISITKAITLNGAKAGLDARSRSTASGETILDGTGMAGTPYDAIKIANAVSNVVIDGFEIRNYSGSGSNGDGNGISSYCMSASTTGANNVTVKNNYIHHVAYNGILVGSENASGASMVIQTGWLVQYNKIAAFTYAGVEFTNVSNSAIKDNDIAAPTTLFADPGDAGVGIEIAARSRSQAAAIVNIEVSGNNITGAFPAGSRAGINILARAYGSGSNAGITGLTVDGNTITDATNVRAAILVVAETRNVGPSAITSLAITNNVLDGNLAGIVIQDYKNGGTNATHSAVTVTGNDIKNSTGNGFYVSPATAATGIAVSDNSFTSNTLFAINNAGTGDLSATPNWFGSAAGANVLAAVSGAVAVEPWLADGTDADPEAIGFQPTETTTGTLVAASATAVDASCPASSDGSIEVSFTGGTALYTIAWSGTATGLVDTVTTSPFTIEGLAAGTYEVIVTDVNGTADTLTEIVIAATPDGTNPTITLATVEASYDADTDKCTASLDLTATATDNCGEPTIKYFINYGEEGQEEITFPYDFAEGSTIVTVEATDLNENTATSPFTVVVVDNQNPVITLPTIDASYNADEGKCDYSATFTATATDNCGEPTIKYFINYGEEGQEEITFPYVFAVGSTIVTVEATDVHENTATSPFTVVVVDNQNPVITLPTVDASYNADEGNCDYSATFTATATDNCGEPTIKYFINYGEEGQEEITFPYVFAVGSTIVTVEATDLNENTATSPFTVVVVDNQNPVITLPTVDASYNADEGKCDYSATFTATATDNCGEPTIKYFINYGEEGQEEITFPYVFAVGSTIVTVEATDVHENTATSPFTVVVVDNQDPVITCPVPDESYDTDAGKVYKTLTLEATATDNCNIENITYYINFGEEGEEAITFPYQFPFGETVVTAIATDVHERTDQCQFTVNVDNVTTDITVGDIIVTTSPTQYSDKVTYSAAVSPWPSAPALSISSALPLSAPGGVIKFYVGTEFVGQATVGDDGIATLTDDQLSESLFDLSNYEAGNPTNGLLKPGIYDVTVEFVSSNPDYLDKSAVLEDGLEITQEDAIVKVDNTDSYFTANPTSGKGTVWFRADVADTDDGADSRGDIRNAVVQFLDGAGTGSPIGPTRNVGLIDPADTSKGVAVLAYNTQLTATEMLNGGHAWLTWAEAGNYYTGEDRSDMNIVVLAMPGGDFVTGGGHYIMENSGGLYAGTTDKRMNFGFNMKWNKSGKSLQGQINIIYRRMIDDVMHIYHIKSNAIDALAVTTATLSDGTFNTATMTAKASLADITDPLNVIDYGGGHLIRVVAYDNTDKTSGGKLDKISVELLNSKTSQLLYSSYIAGSKTAVRTITGGNINVRNTSNIGIDQSCGVPAGLTATNVTSDTAKLTWMAVPGATSYNVQYRAQGSAEFNPLVSITTNYVNLKSLTAGTTYEWQVQTVCSTATSAFANLVSFTTVSVCVAHDLIVSSITTTGATLNWSGPEAATYKVEFRKAGARKWTAVTIATTSYTLINLTTGTTYDWKVTAICSGNPGTPVSGQPFVPADIATIPVTSASATPAAKEVLSVMPMTAVANPNPTTGQFNLVLSGFSDAKIQVKVVSAYGQVVLLKEHALAGGRAIIPVNLDNAARGVYIVQVTQGKTIKTIKVLKQ